MDETTFVVMSEMGRTPALNGNEGKDHWPYTSALVMGPGLQGSETSRLGPEQSEGEELKI